MKPEEAQAAADQSRRLENPPGAFLAGVSQELHLLLTHVLAPLEGLLSGERGPIPDDQKDSLDTAYRSSLRLRRTVNGLLDFFSRDPAPEAALPGETSTPRDEDRPKVLIAEADPEIAASIQELLSGTCDSRVAPDGDQALHLVRTWSPDLVFAEVSLPIRNGFDLCRGLKADPATLRIPVVLLTSLTFREAFVRGWDAGVDEFLFKPFVHAELAGRVRSILKAARDRKQAGEELIAPRQSQVATEQERLQRALLQRDATIRTVFETVSQGILVLDGNCGVVLANSKAEEMFGYARQELVRTRYETLVPPAAPGQPLHGQRPDGSRFPIEVSLNFNRTAEDSLAVVLVSDVTSRKRIEGALSQSEERLRMALESNGLGIFDIDVRTGKRVWSNVTRQYMGLPANAEVDETTFGRALHPADRDRMLQLLKEGMGPQSRGRYITEFRVVGIQDGVERWLSALGQLIRDESGFPERFLGVVQDISERKQQAEALEASRDAIRALAANLLSAQEVERRRVSRELHDQTCQQLASLAMNIGALAANPPPRKDARREFKALQARVVRASDEVRHIAYELHPLVLDDLGLTASLRELCHEFSGAAPGIALQCVDIAAPPVVPREAASCIYRVAQESLHNIAKHAAAARVSVSLAVQAGALVLSVADDGAGFDPEAARGRGGLGLIGMEERARLVKGTLTIDAQHGRGATVALSIPLTPAGE